MKTLCEITWTAYKFVWREKRDRNLSMSVDQNVPFSPLLSSILFGIYFTSVHIIHSKRTLSFFLLLFFFLLNFLHIRAWKISDVIPNGNETNLHPKNEVFIPHASLLLNLWKPESESAFLLITDVLLLAALSQCLWLCPGFSVYLGAQLIQLILASLYLQHHFAALWPTATLLPWCFTPLSNFGLAPHQKTKEMTAAAARPKHGVITAIFGIERERQRVLEVLQKTKIKGTGIYEVGIKRQRKTLRL